VFGDINWTSVEQGLPEYNRLVLAKGLTYSGVALARHIPGLGKWHVQPFKSKWYSTRHGITHWAPLGYIILTDDNKAFLSLLEELRVTDELLNERNKVMNAIPPCPMHGHQCVPHALEWIKERVLQQVIDIAQGAFDASQDLEMPQYIPTHVMAAINTILKHLHDSDIESMQVIIDDTGQRVVMRINAMTTITLQYDSEEVDICPKCGHERDEAGICWDCDIQGTPCGGDE